MHKKELLLKEKNDAKDDAVNKVSRTTSVQSCTTNGLAVSRLSFCSMKLCFRWVSKLREKYSRYSQLYVRKGFLLTWWLASFGLPEELMLPAGIGDHEYIWCLLHGHKQLPG